MEPELELAPPRVEHFDMSSLVTEADELDPELREFHNTRRMLCELGIEENFYHNNSKQASMAISVILETSKDIRILCNDMDGSISDHPPYLKSFNDAILMGKRVRILYRNPPRSDSKLFRMIRHYFGKCANLIMKKANPDLDQALRDNFKEIIHFTLGDRNKTRVETNIKQQRGVYSFNNDSLNAELSSFFEQHFEKSVNITPNKLGLSNIR